MVEASGEDSPIDLISTEECLSRAQALVPIAQAKARDVKGFPARWKTIISKLNQIPSRLSDLSSHPCFSKNMLCKEQMQAVSKTLNEVIQLAELCETEKYEGKLRMQSDLDSLATKLDLNLRDCGLLIKTGVLGEVSFPSSVVASTSAEGEYTTLSNLRELLARLQIGNMEAKHKALDCLLELMREDERNVLAVIGRSNISALVQLLAATPQIREKTVTVICSLAETGTFDNWLVSESALMPLIRLIESGSAVGKEKAAITLQRLSMSSETARAIVGHGGVRPLMEVCRMGDSVSQASAVCTLKNISTVEDTQEALAEEGIVKMMINLLDCGILLGSKEYAAECLQHLTLSNEDIKKSVIAEGGVKSLLAYLDGSLPQESAVGALRNLAGLIPNEDFLSFGVLQRLARVLKSGSLQAQESAASAIYRVCGSAEMKRAVGEAGCIPLLVRMLEAKGNNAREFAAQAICSLMTLSHNRKEVKKYDKSVPNLVALLDPSPHNTAKKYAVSCLLLLSSLPNHNLNHKNIVKYIGSLKTKTHLHITKLFYVYGGKRYLTIGTLVYWWPCC